MPSSRSRTIIALLVAIAGLVAAPAAHAAAPWLSPAPFAPASVTQTIQSTSAAMGPDGHAAAMAARYDGTRYRALAGTRQAGQDLGPAETLSSDASAVTATSVTIEVSADGTATAAWLRVDPGNAALKDLEVSQRPAGGSWGPPQAVRSGADIDISGAGAPGIALSVGDSGRAVVAWVERSTSVGERVFAAKKSSGVPFAPATQLSASGAASDTIWFEPAVAMDAAGDYVATWQRSHIFTGTTSTYVNEAVAVSTGGSAGSVRQLTSLAGGAGDPPKVAITPTGRALIAGNFSSGGTSTIDLDQLTGGLTTFETGTWQSVASPASATPLGSVRVAIEPGGGATLAWAQSDVVYSSVRPTAPAAFSAPKALSGPSSASAVVLAQGASGDALIVWPAGNGDGSTSLLSARRRAGAEAFGDVTEAVRAVPPSGGSTALFGLGLGVDDQGNALLSFVRQSKDAESVFTYTAESVGFDAAAPSLSVTVPGSGTAGSPLSFAAVAGDRMSASSITWDYGDGASGAGASTTHTYATAGSYAVKATATDQGGNAAETTRVVQVAAAPDTTTTPSPPPITTTTPLPPATTTTTPLPSATTTTTPLPPPITTTTPPPPGPMGAVDADSDGIPAARDCNDADARIRPGAREVVGNRVDEDCDGVAAPFPVVTARPVLSWTPLKDGRTRIKRLRVDRLQAGDRVSLRCSGPGCRKKARASLTSRRSRISLTSAVSGLRLSPKARLVVVVTRTGATARVVTFTMVRRADPTRTQRCQDPGAARQRRC